MATPSGQAPTAKGADEAAEVTEDVVDAAAKRDSIIAHMKTLSVDEDVTAMFAGSDLSEDFKSKAKTIFETAVIARALMVVEKMEQEILEASEEAVKEIQTELEEQVDSYLDHMVNEWMTQNEVAIEKGLKTEITEEFIGALRQLFVEHNMSIPEEQVDVVEQLSLEVESLTTKLNETLNTNVELSKKINEAKKVEIFASVCEGLTATQAEKLKTLTEGVDFVTADDYQGKLKVIREQYFSKQVNKAPASPVALNESADPAAADAKEVPVNMQGLVGAMTRFAKS
jgi:hypothetical protein